jgi:hypothetical protein
MADKSTVKVLTGKAAATAADAIAREWEKDKAQLDAAGVKSYEGVILTEDGTATSLVTGDEADD